MEGTGLMMNTKNFADTMRENLLLALVLAVALLGAGLGVFKAHNGGIAAAATTVASGFSPNAVMGNDQMREMLLAPPADTRLTFQEEKQKAVARHRTRYDSNPNDPDAETLLRAMGNLYKQTGDTKNAAWAYQTLLLRFPDGADTTSVRMELAGCYELLGERENLTGLYLEMMKTFPQDSNEYKYAQASLNMSGLKLKQRNPNGAQPQGPEGSFAAEELADVTSDRADSEVKLSRKGSASVQNRGV